MQRFRRYRKWVIASAVVALVAAGLGGVVLWQNTYAMDERRVSIRHGGHRLQGVLTTPRDGGTTHGLVVFVHGDGPVDATHEGGYRPMWEAFAKAGYATLSWDKPGVAGAPGNWLDQSMDDRADETAAAVAWARARPGINADRVGLWGASQAGWVMPKVAHRTRVDFVVAVSPAVNWLRQGRFNLLAELRADGASPARTKREIARSDRVRELLARGATFDEYVRAQGGDADGMTADRWGFVLRNHAADATADLRALRGIPVLLVLPGQDVNVDTAETGAAYRKALDGSGGGGLEVRDYPDAAHSMVKAEVEASEVRLTLAALFAPRSLFAEGFLGDQRRFLRGGWVRGWVRVGRSVRVGGACRGWARPGEPGGASARSAIGCASVGRPLESDWAEVDWPEADWLEADRSEANWPESDRSDARAAGHLTRHPVARRAVGDP